MVLLLLLLPTRGRPLAGRSGRASSYTCCAARPLRGSVASVGSIQDRNAVQSPTPLPGSPHRPASASIWRPAAPVYVVCVCLGRVRVG